MTMIRTLAGALALISLVGCATLTPAQKKWVAIGTGVLVVGAYAAHRSDNGGSPPSQTQPPLNDCSASVFNCAPVK
jgi:hypothetical protein